MQIMEKKIKTWLKRYRPDELGIVLKPADLDFGYLLVLEFENKEKMLAASRNPTHYVNMYMSRNKHHAVDNVEFVSVSPKIIRSEAVKRAINKKLSSILGTTGTRYLVPEDVFMSVVNDVFAITKLRHFDSE